MKCKVFGLKGVDYSVITPINNDNDIINRKYYLINRSFESLLSDREKIIFKDTIEKYSIFTRELELDIDIKHLIDITEEIKSMVKGEVVKFNGDKYIVYSGIDAIHGYLIKNYCK